MRRLIVLPEALQDLSRLDKAVAQRIADKLSWLSENADSIPHRRLSGKFVGLNKLRVGDWRIIYGMAEETETVYVHKIGHRSEIYK